MVLFASFFLGIWGLFSLFDITKRNMLLINHRFVKKALILKTILVLINTQVHNLIIMYRCRWAFTLMNRTRSGPNIPAVGYWRGVILRDLTGDLWPQNGLLVAFFTFQLVVRRLRTSGFFWVNMKRTFQIWPHHWLSHGPYPLHTYFGTHGLLKLIVRRLQFHRNSGFELWKIRDK